MKEFIKKLKSNKSGEITIEAMLVTIPTIFVLLFLISLGFLLYQHWNMQIAVDDAASKIAGTYAVLDADDKTGNVNAEGYRNVQCYRNLQIGFFGSAGDYIKSSEKRVNEYLVKRLNKTSFAKSIGDPTIDFEIVKDGYARKHISITAKSTFRIPFSEGLELFGMSGKREYTATASADCVDMLDYVNAVKFAEVAPSYIDSKVADAVTEWMKVIQSIRNFNK
ncbi:MAG: TadE/TadG family type IV pilus assembly protein [Ruminococcus sp.]